MRIVPWDPFLMKKLLKSEIYGSVNSTRMHSSWNAWSKVVATVHKQ